MKSKARLLICIFVSTLLLGIQNPAASNAAAAGPDINVQRVDAYLAEVKSKVPSPGFSVVVVQNDKIVFAKGYGVEIAGTDNPMTENTSTAIGSFTKSFTALAVMQIGRAHV
jgi:CubicO group peptidase (beta-lactamase class C family)